MPDGDRRKVTLDLDAALVERAERLGKDLSLTVERALRRMVPVRSPMSDEDLEAYVADANERFERVGLAADDYIEPQWPNSTSAPIVVPDGQSFPSS